MRIVMLGAPGSGKGTQAKLLAQRFAVPHVSSGDLLRAEVAAGSALGQKVAGVLDRGELVPDELVVRIVLDALAEAGPGYILDGFPRTLSQARLAEDARPGEGLADAVVFLALPDDVARRRLAARAEGRSDDRDPEVIENRLRRFHTDTDPLVGLYRDRGLLVTVDGSQLPDAVTAGIVAALAGAGRG
jgi:adenylate kinase